MRYVFLPILLALWTTGCSQGEFAGDSGAAVGDRSNKCNPQKDPLCKPVTPISTPDVTPPPGLSTDDGGKIADCAKGTMIEDPNQTYSFARGEERSFLNTLNQYVQIPVTYEGQGAVHADQATADVVCKLKGFNKAISFSNSKWYSPRDNVNSTWVDSDKKFVLKSATVSNLKLENTVCKGRLYDQCDKDKSWIFQKP